MAARAKTPALRTFHSQLVVQANAYMNATWAVAVAKAGDEDGSGLIGGSCIVDPNGRIVAEAATLTDEIIVADCDLDICRQGKEKMFNFAAHRRPGAVPPDHQPSRRDRAGGQSALGAAAMSQAPSPALAENLPDLSGLPIARRAHFGRWTAALLIVVALLALGRAFAKGQIEWSYVGQFLTAPTILYGIINTVVMAVAAMALGIVLGVVVAVMRLSPNPVLRIVASGYAWLFRGTPVILQLLLWFNLALVFPVVGIPGVWTGRAVDVMTPFLSALLGLGINQGAYTSEVMRAGMLSVDIGQYEAAQAIGMGRLLALRRIIAPQAMRVVIPPLGNEFIGMVKLTSLASVIQYPEVLHNAENIYYANSRVIELLIVAGLWYLAVVSVLTPLQMLLERRFARGFSVGAR